MTETEQTEREGQLDWFQSLLDTLLDGDIETGIEAVKAAVKLLERNNQKKKEKLWERN